MALIGLVSCHPISNILSFCFSPLGATKTKSPFMGSKCFSRANQELVNRGFKPIDWRVDGALDDHAESPSKEETEAVADDFDV